MKKVLITGWKPGFNKVQFNRLIRECSGFGLAEAHRMVCSLTEGKVLSLEISNEKLDYFCKEAKELGAIFQIEQ